ncbi:hypothetical protein Cgig2_021366 [Carnegiea gigantea]|uniref:Uncharacterized protein n=1 Tax=Carnegiea gigantea TaxID=171969 RepID=A0A9Q1KDV0_9CARY|nr:hypothetical protein Cgig2_021366 [Carnegiea gigantea]
MAAEVGRHQVSEPSTARLDFTSLVIAAVKVGKHQVSGPSAARLGFLTLAIITVEMGRCQFSGVSVVRLGFFIVTIRQTTTSADNYFDLVILWLSQTMLNEALKKQSMYNGSAYVFMHIFSTHPTHHKEPALARSQKQPPHELFAELARVYGPLMLLCLGEVPTIIVSSADMAREVMRTRCGAL